MGAKQGEQKNNNKTIFKIFINNDTFTLNIFGQDKELLKDF